MRLKGKTALISGAGRNIGKAIALTYAREGADLILLARTAADVNKVAAECEGLGVQALAIAADVGNHEEVNRAVQLGLARFGKVDVLTSVAAIRPHKPVQEISYDEWHRVYAVNVHATFYLAKALVPGMMERRSGAIVALGGMVSLTALKANTTANVSSKHSVYGLIKSLALELGPYGIRANLVCVGPTTGTVRRNPEWYADSPGGEPHGPAMMASTPLRRGGTHQEVANTALFLASDASSYITGDRILCAGGRYM